MTERDLVPFSLGAFALIVGMKLWVVLCGTGGGLKEGRPQHLHAALAHFGVSFPLALWRRRGSLPIKAWSRAETLRLLPECKISLGNQARILATLMGPKPGRVSSKALVF